MSGRVCVGVAGVLLIVWQAAGMAAMPQRTGRFVNDFADVLPAAVEQQLEGLLRETERATTGEIVVVTVRSLEGTTVDRYARRLFNQWRIGKARVDNGVLVLVAVEDRQMRIEVGDGLEPILPDVLAAVIVRHNFTPSFSRGDYPAGVESGVVRLAAIVRENRVVSDGERQALGERRNPLTSALWWILFVALLIAVTVCAAESGAAVRETRWRKLAGALLIGTASIAGMWFLLPPATWLVRAVWVAIAMWSALAFAARREPPTPATPAREPWKPTPGYVVPTDARGVVSSEAPEPEHWIFGRDKQTTTGWADLAADSQNKRDDRRLRRGSGSSGSGGSSGGSSSGSSGGASGSW